jgi:hypothetical protein
MDERDLSFVPVVNALPKKLTSEQIEQYNTDGYVKPFRIFAGSDVDANRDYFDSLLRILTEHQDGRDAYAINCYQGRCRGIWDLATNPLILDHVEDIVGPNIVAWATHFFCKLPGDPKVVPWHQDASYWMITPARTVTVWLAIDDADEDNAAMQFIPGTHRLGPLEWKQCDRPHVLQQEIVGAEKLGKPVFDELRAGEISLHADMLAHGSAANTSSRRRCGLTIRYCPPEVHAVHPDWSAHAILCRGVDPAGHWTHSPRPAGEDLSGPKPKAVGAN